MTSESLPLVYFGKLPARGDFVRARSHISETNDIDTWVSQALTASEYLLPKAVLPKDALTEPLLETNPLKNSAIKEN
uniref:TagF domain-containing protein n=1 Tax=uncultured Psychrobacter sp. TaxID=259303 RepID=UPI0026222B73